LRELGADVSAVAALASVKPAVAEVAKSLGVPTVVYKPEELRLDWDCRSPPSPKALETLGVPGAFLLYRKRVLGRVTVAAAAAP